MTWRYWIEVQYHDSRDTRLIRSKHPKEHRFDDFFRDYHYIILKNYLYNYRLRRRKITGIIAHMRSGPLLEVGSGLSPIVTGKEDAVYSDLSFEGLRRLKRMLGTGKYVVADCTRLPFNSGMFSQVIASEVLEHVEQDREAVHEMARVLAQDGSVVVTYPHRRAYFWNDDRFVQHFRRYEVEDMESLLAGAGLSCSSPQKVLGPLEKITMSCLIYILERCRTEKESRIPRLPFGILGVVGPLFALANLFWEMLAWLDALIAPKRLASVLLVCGRKCHTQPSSDRGRVDAVLG